MSLLRKLVARPFEYLLLLEAFVVLGLARVGLRFFHFQQVRRVLLLIGNVGRRLTQRRTSPEVLVWTIQTAKRKNPFQSTCLMDALAAEALFRQCGYEPILCIGAAVHAGKFAAHAWLENEKAVMVGGTEADVQQFTRFPDFVRIL